MTYKYLMVRRDIYENCSDKKIKKLRTFKEIRNLLRKFHWIILALTSLSLIAFITITILPINNLWLLIPVVIVIASAIISEVYTDKNYNKEARAKELSERYIAYEEYITSIKEMLEKNKINTDQKIQFLKEECTKVLERHEQKYLSVRSRIYDMLIGVPLGALISSLIYKSEETLINEILYIIIIGILIICLSRIIKLIRFYSDGYFKDRYLLNALNEIQYSE